MFRFILFFVVLIHCGLEKIASGEMRFWEAGKLLDPRMQPDAAVISIHDPILPEITITEDIANTLWHSARGFTIFKHILTEQVGAKEYGVELVKNNNLIGNFGYSIAGVFELYDGPIGFEPADWHISDIEFGELTSRLTFTASYVRILRYKISHMFHLMFNDMNNLRILPASRGSFVMYLNYPKNKTVFVFTYNASTGRFRINKHVLMYYDLFVCHFALFRRILARRFR